MERSLNSGVGVEAIEIHRRLGNRRVLNGLSISLLPGESVAVVGESGCGKTTLLRLLAGLDRPDKGSIRIDGREWKGICPSVRVMFQEGRLLPWMSIRKNITLGLTKPNNDWIDELLQRVGLCDRANDWPSRLSGGQKQRVSLARALASCPKVLLLDEPLGSLDALTRIEMQNLIEELWLQQPSTQLLITHDIDEAVAIADRVVLLRDGRADREWKVDLDRPRNRGSADFQEIVHTIRLALADG